MHPFIEHLHAIYDRDDRAALGALRRGAGAEASVYPIVAPFFPRDPDRWMERALVETASLFALYPGKGGLPVGKALRKVQEVTGSGSVEQRFVALLDAHRDDLPTHLRHAVSLARAGDVSIDWQDIFDGLRFWNDPDRRVQRRWARDYWSSTQEEEA